MSDSVLALHVALGGAVVVLGFGVFAWGLLRVRRMATPGGAGEQLGQPAQSAAPAVQPTAPARRGRRVDAFTQLLALSQSAVFACGLLGLVLLARAGSGPDDPLHSRVYGPFMVLAIIAAYGFRTGDARWNTRVFAITSLFVAGLGVRAFYTG